jgi:uncharacterized membrane protein
MESRAKLFGHPVHQQLVSLPLGMLAAAVLFDLAALFGGYAVAAELAYWTMGVGIALGVLAAGFGVIDYVAVPKRTRAARIGWLHGLGNTIVIALFFGSWAVRYANDHQPTNLAWLLSFSGGALALVTAWLGGELVSKLGIGVADDAHVDAPSSIGPASPRRSPLP